MRYRLLIWVTLLSLCATECPLSAAPGLIFQSQSRSVTASGKRLAQFYNYSQSNNDLGPWSLHPTFPDTIALSHDSTITSLNISDTTDFDLDARAIGSGPGSGDAREEMHLVFAVDSPTPFRLMGQETQQVDDPTNLLGGVGAMINLTGFTVLPLTPLEGGVYPFDVSGTFQPGQVYHLDLIGAGDTTASPNGPLEVTASYSMQFSLAVLPEPASLLGLLSITGLLLCRRRR